MMKKVAYMVGQRRRRLELGVVPQAVPYDFGDFAGAQSKETSIADVSDIITNWLPFRPWYIEEKHFH